MHLLKWPGRLFWEFAARSVFKVAWFTAILGAVWAVLSFIQVGSQSGAANTVFVLSQLIDTTFVFLVVSSATAIGLALQSWDVIGMLFTRARGMMITQLIISLVLTLGIAVLLRYLEFKFGIGVNAGAVVVINLVIAATIAFNFAYHAYCVYLVMDGSTRRQYQVEVQSRNLGATILGTFLPIDKTKPALGIIQAGVVVLVATYLSQLIAHLLNLTQFMNFVLAIVCGLSFCIWAIGIRVIDAIKPFGQKERLYPYFEDYR